MLECIILCIRVIRAMRGIEYIRAIAGMQVLGLLESLRGSRGSIYSRGNSGGKVSWGSRDGISSRGCSMRSRGSWGDREMIRRRGRRGKRGSRGS